MRIEVRMALAHNENKFKKRGNKTFHTDFATNHLQGDKQVCLQEDG
jgi:hypothetical protein